MIPSEKLNDREKQKAKLKFVKILSVEENKVVFAIIYEYKLLLYYGLYSKCKHVISLLYLYLSN